MAGGAPPRAPDLRARPAPANIQVFGRRDSRDTQRALRFFSERRLTPTFVDLARKPMAPTELRRFSSRLTSAALVDRQSRAFIELGLAYLRIDNNQLFERLLVNQALLLLPLVRVGERFSVGVDEQSWRRWLSEAAADDQ